MDYVRHFKPSPRPAVSAKLFPAGRVHPDDGFRNSPSNQGEAGARLQAQEKQNDESAIVREVFS
jgi:hypothetical protein